MRVSLVHISDIHFRTKANPILDVVQHFVQAINSADASISLVVIVISGDIAFSGKWEEYKIALKFCRDVSKNLKVLHPGMEVEFLSVPGNHDCVLPESGVKLRETLIQGMIPSMQEMKQDPDLLKQLLKPQATYNRFRSLLRKSSTKWNGLCETVVIEHGGKTLQFNLYNTALLSSRKEQQGELYVPITTFGDQIALRIPSALCVSVFHHSFLWLESNIAVSFRTHIENTSDIALSGHQHYSHTFYKENSTGERVLYIEAPALQDEQYPKTSAFRVLVFDWDTEQERVITFRRSRDLYRRHDESEWRPLTVNRAVRANFRLNPTFDSILNQHGIPLAHQVKGHLNLRDIFVFPNLTIRQAGTNARRDVKEVRGEEVLGYVGKANRIVFQASAFGGKTALARQLFWEIFRRGGGIPLLLNGCRITSAEEAKVLNEVWRTFSSEYDPKMLDEFRQLPKVERILIIDDWDKTELNSEGRTVFLKVATQHFEKVFLFTSDVFQIHELIERSTETVLDFDQATVMEFGHTLRGKLIDKWVTLGREYTGDLREMNREIEEKERLIQNMIGKNTLPSLPYIILSLLQADEVDKAEAAEAGSFGYLYDVLVTVALSTTKGPKAQLEKKYVFLAILAYRMYKAGTKMLPLSRVKEIADEYAKSHLVAVDFESMIADLEEARVFIKIDGNYGFAYPHLFYYFIARYYKDNLDRDGSLRAELERMVDDVSSDESSSILMFIVYFAKHSKEIVERLVSNGNRIYSGTTPADMESDVDFLNRLEERPSVVIPDEDIDVRKVRDERREFRDRMQKSADTSAKQPQKHVVYSEGLSDKDKFDLAYRHIDLLGQIIRNFPASLPGEDKLTILKAAYLLARVTSVT